MENLENQTEEIKETAEKFTRREALGTIGKVVAASAVGMTVMSNTAAAQTTNLEFVVETYHLWMYSYPQYGHESLMFIYSAGNRQYCQLYFMKDGVSIPANTIAADGMSGRVYFPRSRFAEIRDLLRYEKPVRIVVTTGGVASLSTYEQEAVGDHDI
jgi:hypothetical protein